MATSQGGLDVPKPAQAEVGQGAASSAPRFTCGDTAIGVNAVTIGAMWFSSLAMALPWARSMGRCPSRESHGQRRRRWLKRWAGERAGTWHGNGLELAAVAVAGAYPQASRARLEDCAVDRARIVDARPDTFDVVVEAFLVADDGHRFVDVQPPVGEQGVEAAKPLRRTVGHQPVLLGDEGGRLELVGCRYYPSLGRAHD